MTLPTLPGSKIAWTLRALRSPSEVSAARAGSTAPESASTSTLPVAGSMTTTQPQSAPCAVTASSIASWAIACRSGSMVVRTVVPGTAEISSCSPVGMMAPVLPISTLPSPSVPVRASFWVSSRPAEPMRMRSSPSWV